ncbi:MAG: transcription antitermination factor NusB [Puniceicoccaceae bacterium]|nr:transcription antitermination factor NusB [Puniceicoccaceae bacterium]RCL30529.1 MAG: transcription antitermination factor NusB [Puniceicoccaceae bacterium]
MDSEKPVKKPSPRRANRMATIQFLYQWEANRPEELLDSLRVFLEDQEEERAYYAFAESLILGVIQHIDQIDNEISQYASNWKLERIAKVDLAILRLALFELHHRSDIPPIVTINEAIDLGKTFSDTDSKRFINGILDQVKNTIQRPLRKANHEE